MLLQVDQLSAGYGKLQILREVSIQVAEGELVVLIGPNGAGKSTVLKSIYGLTHRTHGQIRFRDQEISELPTHALLEAGIGFVPQGRTVFADMTVRENLEMGGYLLNHRATREQKIEDAFNRFPALREKQTERAGALSGGQQQQLAIARALMMSPALLLLDEPTLGLSPKLMHELFVKLREIKESGTALLVVEQNVRLALSYADRGYLLANGEVRVAGSAEDLARPELMREAFLK